MKLDCCTAPTAWSPVFSLVNEDINAFRWNLPWCIVQQCNRRSSWKQMHNISVHHTSRRRLTNKLNSIAALFTIRWSLQRRSHNNIVTIKMTKPCNGWQTVFPTYWARLKESGRSRRRRSKRLAAEETVCSGVRPAQNDAGTTQSRPVLRLSRIVQHDDKVHSELWISKGKLAVQTMISWKLELSAATPRIKIKKVSKETLWKITTFLRCRLSSKKFHDYLWSISLGVSWVPETIML